MHINTYFSKVFALCFLLCGWSGLSHAQLLEQRKKFTEADSLRGMLRPERTCFDVHFYELNVIVDTVSRSLLGSVKIHFKATTDFSRLQLDLFDSMRIDQIVWNRQPLAFNRRFNAVFVDFPQAIRKDSFEMIEVFYHGKTLIAKRAPWDGGFTWTYDTNGKLWVGVACEGLGASSWWPCKDHLSDEPDSMQINLSVPYGLAGISNGTFMGTLRDKVSDGLMTFRWRVNYPINTYNVTINIGDYEEFSDEFDCIGEEILQISYYVLRSNLEKAKMHFNQVKPMLQCYEKYLGKYPFMADGYALVETPYLGMEHQGAIAYGNNYRKGYNGADFSRIGLGFDYIIIHETGHEWWGNSVSCSDIADLWIHEGFCTYSEAIYVECMHGYDTALLYVNAKKSSVGNREPIIGVYDVNEEGSGDMYNKGMLMLNTLRFVVNNDKLWWSLIKNISDTTFRHRVTNTKEIMEHMDRYTGMKLSGIMTQYLYYSNIPLLEYSTKRKGNTVILTCNWKTDVTDFSMPIYVNGSYGKPGQRLEVTNSPQTFILQLKKGEKFELREELGYYKASLQL